jgi:kojibiose phosphorylase
MADATPAPLQGSDFSWTLRRSVRRRAEDSYYESLFGLSNGRIGIRATVDFDTGEGRPGCFHSDVYGPAITVPSHIVNVLNPTYRALTVGGLPVTLDDAVEFTQELDLQGARHMLSAVLRDALGRTTRLRVTIMLPAPHPDVVVSRLEVTAVDHDAEIVVITGIDWSPGNGDFGGVHDRVRLHHLHPVARRHRSGRLTVIADNVGGGGVVAAAAIVVPTTGGLVTSRDRHAVALPWRGEQGQTCRVDQIAVLLAGDDAGERIEARLDEVTAAGIEPVLAAHNEIWRQRWLGATEIEGRTDVVAAWRYAQFQLFQSVDRKRSVTCQPARALTSEYHSGHMFFNSEFFVLPYLAYTVPDAAAAMLRFRVTTLDAARAYASETGFRGARFPEEVDRAGLSASPHVIHDVFRGTSCTEWSGQQVMHLSADVLHALATYLDATGDIALLRTECVPLVVHAATYLADLMRPDPNVGGRGARRVMGFDEYHYDIDHSFSTNLLAKWALQWAADQVDWLRSSTESYLAQCLRDCGVDDRTTAHWRQVAAEIYLPPAVDGVIPVFAGYLKLPDQLRNVAADHRLPVLDGGDTTRAQRLERFDTRLVKQSDVVFVMTLLPHLFDRDTVATNLAFYEPRTVHGSSLSMTGHAVAAARTGDRQLATELLLASMRYNLDFTHRDGYVNGVHLAAYAGSWLTLFRGFLGARTAGDVLWLDPVLPVGVDRIRLPVSWRSHHLMIDVDDVRCRVTAAGTNPGPAKIGLQGRHHTVAPGQYVDVNSAHSTCPSAARPSVQKVDG